jgi:two-component system, OmpR family, phosphate regulon response regulator OmpR
VSERVLIVDDDRKLAAMLVEYLRPRGLDAEVANDAAAGLLALVRSAPDVVVLDVMLPDLDGFEVCRRMRATSDVPILMLTARGDPEDRIVGLEIGADDYLGKPFDPRELLARLRALLRRRRAGLVSGTTVLRFGALEIDVEARRVSVSDAPCALTGYQFELLLLLARNAGRVLSRNTIMDRLRREPHEAFDRSIDVHISRIRAAIGEDPKQPQRILTVRGAGYQFVRLPGEERP